MIDGNIAMANERVNMTEEQNQELAERLEKIKDNVCGRCWQNATELYECERCGVMFCDNCKATYDQFSQIDFNCCKSCESHNDD